VGVAVGANQRAQVNPITADLTDEIAKDGETGDNRQPVLRLRRAKGQNEEGYEGGDKQAKGTGHHRGSRNVM
jgi:hypothetical protein